MKRPEVVSVILVLVMLAYGVGNLAGRRHHHHSDAEYSHVQSAASQSEQERDSARAQARGCELAVSEAMRMRDQAREVVVNVTQYLSASLSLDFATMEAVIARISAISARNAGGAFDTRFNLALVDCSVSGAT